MRAFFAALLAFILLGSTAEAQVYWFAGEDTSNITLVGSVGPGISGSSGGQFNPAFSRYGLGVGNGTTVADPPTVLLKSPTFTSCSNPCWFHAAVASFGANATTNNEQALIIYGTDGVGRLYLRQTGTAGTLKLSTANAARSFTDLGTSTAIFQGSVAGTWSTSGNTIDLLVNYTCSGAGGATLYVNGVLGLTYTGNLCTDSNTALNQVAFANINGATSNGSGGGTCTCWSEMIVAAQDTRAMHVATLSPQGSGATQSWIPNTLGNINKQWFSGNDASFVSTAANNAISEWTAPTAAPTGTWSVLAVEFDARILRNPTGPQNAEFIAHVSGSDHTSLCTNPSLVTSAFTNFQCVMTTSPATGTAWAITEVYNTGANQLSYGVESLP